MYSKYGQFIDGKWQQSGKKETYDVINHSNYKFLKRAKENNELYGSIKPLEISRAIEDSKKVKIKPSQIDLTKKINTRKIITYSYSLKKNGPQSSR